MVGSIVLVSEKTVRHMSASGELVTFFKCGRTKSEPSKKEFYFLEERK